MLNIVLKFGNEKGMVLPLGLMFLAIIAILGTTAVIITTTDLKIGTNYKLSEQAFYTAEAGVQEAILRISLANDSTETIAQWGSQVSVNGVTNAYIGDPSGYDPNWQVKIYFVEDAATLTSPDTATLLPKANWPNMNYEVTIRHEKESDIGDDLNGDGDTDDLVFYNPSVGKNATNFPPGDGKPITWIESIGKSGTSQHTICVEATKEVFEIVSKAAIAVNNSPAFSGNSTILGFNFKKETNPGFSGYTKTIDEIKVRIGDPSLDKDHYGDSGTVEADGTGDAAIDVPYAVDNSGNWMLQDSGHLPGAVSTGDTISPSGSNAVFGGHGTQTWKDESLSSWAPIQDVLFDPLIYSDDGERLSMLNDLLAKANITDADLESNGLLKSKEPIGIIYIKGDLDLCSATPLPSSGYGQGILYVQGNLKVTGNIKFKGLVFVEGDLAISGTFWNLGTILTNGTSIDFMGNAKTLYSEEVMDDLEDFTRTVKILSWKDVF